MESADHQFNSNELSKPDVESFHYLSSNKLKQNIYEKTSTSFFVDKTQR